MPMMTEQGRHSGLPGSVTTVHKPLGSGAVLSKQFDAFLGSEGGVLVPKGHPVAKEMREYYQYLKQWYGNEEFVKLYREGNLYNFYVKKTGPTTKEVGAVDSGGPTPDKPESGNDRQVPKP